MTNTMIFFEGSSISAPGWSRIFRESVKRVEDALAVVMRDTVERFGSTPPELDL
jgi:hypothetical protein